MKEKEVLITKIIHEKNLLWFQCDGEEKAAIVPRSEKDRWSSVEEGRTYLVKIFDPTEDLQSRQGLPVLSLPKS